MDNKKLYVVKNKYGGYYNGMNQWLGFLRYAKVYASLDHANNIVKKYKTYEPYIVEIKMFEVGAE